PACLITFLSSPHSRAGVRSYQCPKRAPTSTTLREPCSYSFRLYDQSVTAVTDVSPVSGLTYGRCTKGRSHLPAAKSSRRQPCRPSGRRTSPRLATVQRNLF